MAYEIRPMSLGEILDIGFRLLRNHFWLLVGLAATIYVPLGLVGEAFPIAAGISASGEVLSASPLALVLLSLVTLVVVGVGAPLASAAMTAAVGDIYLGRPTGVAPALRRAWALFMPLAWTTLLSYAIIAAGLLLLIVPGLWLMLAYFVSSQVVLLEGLSGMAALRRSGELMRGNKGRAFLMALAVGVLQAVVSGATTSALQDLPLLGVAVGTVVSTVSMAYLIAVTVVFYFDLRCRRDAFDLEHLARMIEPRGPL